jgi:hypothetical protein
VGIYMFMRSIGVIGLFLIMIACRYGDIVLGEGILVMFSFVYKVFGIMIRVPPLALLVSEYLFGCWVVLFELLYKIYSCGVFCLCKLWI